MNNHPDYPKVLVDSDGLIVLFHTLNQGTVIQSDGSYPIGYYTEHWYELENQWKPFIGTITLNFHG